MGPGARAADPAAAPDKLSILFGPSSDRLGSDGDATLDKASRLYRAGNPIVMIVSGSTDSTGNPARNLTLSERRARVVLDGLVARGIPIERLQLLAAGATEPAVKTGSGVAEAQNRRVDITWR
jgi:outer membrane protein OmpA-like peptidoglycan-associated protein